VDKDFPIHLWDHLVPQAKLTLNSMCGSQLNPNVLAWTQLHGVFDCNHTPIVPPGIHVLIYKKPAVRGTWAPHAIDGWYLGPALQAYWCYTVWSKDMHAQCICDTLTGLPITTQSQRLPQQIIFLPGSLILPMPYASCHHICPLPPSLTVRFNIGTTNGDLAQSHQRQPKTSKQRIE